MLQKINWVLRNTRVLYALQEGVQENKWGQKSTREPMSTTTVNSKWTMDTQEHQESLSNSESTQDKHSTANR